ncbi:MAG: chitobiase/beta-hexosaminidase C-terminal domain-containing protein, partial [Chitinophagaceae bacterium]|nr:chitobiase/beta-hexosaminidase C-terminal domain-containing protein [Chitinophagaceae bacterium]
YYTTDGSEPTTESSLYTEPVAANGVLKFKTFDRSGKSGRTIIINAN